MIQHLLAMTVGPVQEFIAAARRTRDLWFGSHILSEISRAVARAVEPHGQLIFPASTDAPNVANIILVEITTDANLATLAAEVKAAAQREWRDRFAGPVFQEYEAIIRSEIWTDQVDDVVEFYAAWMPLNGNYPEARAQVMRLLTGGRKNCRDFLPAKAKPESRLPKSSLDGLRETVLQDPANWPRRFHARLRVRKGEQLDVVGLVKRVAKVTQGYPSVSRVAADPWLRGQAGKLAPIRAECERLGHDLIRPLDTDAHRQYAAFPFEGTAVFRNRYHELIEEADCSWEDLRQLATAVARLGEPNPYLAVIVADGDKIGETLSRLHGADEHRQFSATLAQFAGQAQEIVNRSHGILVYAGGDDVLAFVPVDKCLDCARELHDTFDQLLMQWGENAKTRITLSVGVAIGHFLENLEDLREYGYAAEKDAKQPHRDGLAVHLHKRGGGPITVRAPWAGNRPSPENWAQAPDTRITGLAVLLHQRRIPNRLATDLNRMADVYENWAPKDIAAQQRVKDAIQQDVLRVIAAKQPRGGGNIRERLQPVLDRVTDAAALRQLAQELLIARQIATACRQALGHGEGKEQ